MKMNCIDNDFIVLVTRYRLLLILILVSFFKSLILRGDPLTAHPGHILGRQTPKKDLN
jgi:hypothetical protein